MGAIPWLTFGLLQLVVLTRIYAEVAHNSPLWLVGLACEAAGMATWLAPGSSTKKHYSTQRIGQEALQRNWVSMSTSDLVVQLRNLPEAVLDQLRVPA